MQDLVAGECGADNPMMDLVKHFTREKGQGWQDAGPGGRGPQHMERARGGRMAGPPPGRLGQQHGGQFFADASGGLTDDLRRMGLGGPERALGASPAAGGWADEFMSSQAGPAASAAPPMHAAERAMFENAFQHAHRSTAAGWADSFAAAPPQAHGPGMAPPPEWQLQQQKEFEASWQQANTPHEWANEFLQFEDTGKMGAQVDDGLQHGGDLTADQQELRDAADELMRNANDPKFKNSKFMNFVKKIGAGEVTFEGNKLVENAAAGTAPATQRGEAAWADEFASAVGGSAQQADLDTAWREATRSAGVMPGSAGDWADSFAQHEGAAWASQFEHEQQHSQQGRAAELADLEEAWVEAGGAPGPLTDAGAQAQVPTTASGYTFETENPFLHEKVSYEEALDRARQALMAGALSTAILWCEAAVQQDLQQPDGWEFLGMSQAENEQEVPAILALQECVRLDPSRSSAHLALAVSYTNELRTSDAFDALETALRSNPRYATLPVPPEAPKSEAELSANRYFPMSARREKMQSLYISAAQLAPEEGLDADVQVGLGVLFNISNEYDKAVDCFEAALRSRPTDSALWNKLGATLANGNRSAEAVDAYARALELRPGYIRARYNLGISCINLKSYHDAAEHFLAALKLQQSATQDSTRRNMSETIWNSLRMSLLMANRQDLAALCGSRDLEPFKEHFDF
eukprot:m.14512 g.14512  ORF g.14512 m.14512 type:complete len:694 (-) comp10467_c0_seq1:1194-3275(-)